MAFSAPELFDRLGRAHQHGRLPHAILLAGPPGSGRRSLAWELAGMVNGVTATEAESHPDIRKLEPESKSRRILIEPFREFCSFFYSTSFHSGAVKTGIIFDADRLQVQAANAFLKTLEEPPPNCLFLLVTSNPALLPITVLSRCAQYELRPGKDATPSPLASKAAAATDGILAAPRSQAYGAALRLARHLQQSLREAREEIEDELTDAFKTEMKRLGDSADEDWIKDEEARLKATVEARALAVRQELVAAVSERVADVLRSRHGARGLRYPYLEATTRRVAGDLNDAVLLRILDGAALMRILLERNVKEDIALEAGCLAMARK